MGLNYALFHISPLQVVTLLTENGTMEVFQFRFPDNLEYREGLDFDILLRSEQTAMIYNANVTGEEQCSGSVN